MYIMVTAIGATVIAEDVIVRIVYGQRTHLPGGPVAVTCRVMPTGLVVAPATGRAMPVVPMSVPMVMT